MSGSTSGRKCSFTSWPAGEEEGSRERAPEGLGWEREQEALAWRVLAMIPMALTLTAILALRVLVTILFSVRVMC